MVLWWQMREMGIQSFALPLLDLFVPIFLLALDGLVSFSININMQAWPTAVLGSVHITSEPSVSGI